MYEKNLPRQDFKNSNSNANINYFVSFYSPIIMEVSRNRFLQSSKKYCQQADILTDEALHMTQTGRTYLLSKNVQTYLIN